jgi:hypothetical protein
MYRYRTDNIAGLPFTCFKCLLLVTLFAPLIVWKEDVSGGNIEAMIYKLIYIKMKAELDSQQRVGMQKPMLQDFRWLLHNWWLILYRRIILTIRLVDSRHRPKEK